MEPLRVVLFLGLVFHKALWEVLKRRASDAGPIPLRPRSAKPVKVLKGLVLTFLVGQTLFLDLFPISDEPTGLRIIGTVIYFLGLGTAVLGRLQLGKNWVDLEDYGVLPQQALVTTGIYRYIRHPIYTGDLLLLWGLELALNSWLVLGIGIPLAVVIRQALAEEGVLARAFPGYEEYRARTKRFIPFLV